MAKRAAERRELDKLREKMEEVKAGRLYKPTWPNGTWTKHPYGIEEGMRFKRKEDGKILTVKSFKYDDDYNAFVLNWDVKGEWDLIGLTCEIREFFRTVPKFMEKYEYIGVN